MTEFKCMNIDSTTTCPRCLLHGYVQRHGRQGDNVSTKSMRSICAEKNYAKLSSVLKVEVGPLVCVYVCRHSAL